MKTIPDTINTWVVVLLALVLFSAGLGLKDPWPPDEPRYALVAKEMVERGDWLFPRRGGELYPDKPPLFMWAVATVYTLTDSVRLAHQVPSIIASLVTLLLVIDLGRRLWDQKTGLLAGLILITLFQFPWQAKSGQIDALVTMWITLGLYGLLRHLLLGPHWGWYVMGMAGAGFGVITKGVGFLPLLLLLPYVVARLTGFQPLVPLQALDWRWAAGPLAMLAAIGVWLAPMLIIVQQSNDPALFAYRDEILWHQTVDRYAEGLGHIKPFGYLFVQALILWLPVTLFLPWLVAQWGQRLRAHDARTLLLLTWIVLVLLFFNFSAGKRGVYILPATPALALIVAAVLPGVWHHPALQKTARVATAGLTTLILILAAVGLIFSERLIEAEVPYSILLVLLIWGILGLVYAWRINRCNALLALVAFFWSFWPLYGWLGYPLLNPLRSTAPFMQAVGARIGADAPLALVAWPEQFLLFADRPVVTFGYRTPPAIQSQAAARWLTADPKRWAVVREKALAPCFLSDRAIDLGKRHRRHWYLVNRDAVTEACPLSARNPNP